MKASLLRRDAMPQDARNRFRRTPLSAGEAMRTVVLRASDRARGRSSLRLGLGETNRAAALFPLTTLLEKLDALVTLQDAALGTDAAGLFEAGVLRHDWKVVKFGMSGTLGRNDEIARGESEGIPPFSQDSTLVRRRADRGEWMR